MRHLRRPWSNRQSAAIAPKAGEQGLTLVECLVAITVVGITGLLITPPLFISAATRVQNRRAEQALKIAQGEIDRVRLLIEKERQSVGGVDPVTNAPFLGRVLPQPVPNVATAPPPAVLSAEIESVSDSCDTFDGTALPNAQTALQVDIDGDCDIDYFMQTFRDDGTANASDADKLNEFRMGVRVYAASAADNFANLEITEASLKYASGLGNQRVQPLAVLYSDFVWSDRAQSVCEYLDLSSCP
ncbi:MAG: type II secretion system protein [Elainellaceae cyanobacterium]